MLLNICALFAGFAVLVYSADRFVDGAAAIARDYGVSPLLIGLTIVGLGTSAPEILVSGIASWQGNAGLAIGNALGSNIANIGLILGVSALISPLAFNSQLLKRELPVLLATSLICFGLALNGLSPLDSTLMLSGLVLFMFWLVKSARKSKTYDPLSEEIEKELQKSLPEMTAWILFGGGLIGLLVSSKLLVWAAVNLAEYFGISDLVIGLTIVALGTSLPELAASISSVLKKEDDLAVGNVIGSNMYNLLAVYSLPGFFSESALETSVLNRDFPVMLAFTLVLFGLGYGFNKSGTINRIEGSLLLLCYLAYQGYLYKAAIA